MIALSVKCCGRRVQLTHGRGGEPPDIRCASCGCRWEEAVGGNAKHELKNRSLCSEHGQLVALQELALQKRAQALRLLEDAIRCAESASALARKLGEPLTQSGLDVPTRLRMLGCMTSLR